MLYSVLSGVAAFLVCAVLLRIFIPILRRVKLGQKILEIGPSWHKSKEGTPIMGGLFFSIAITAAAVAFSLLSGSLPLRTLLVLCFALLCGLIGFVDDYVKLFKKTNRGLSPMQKLVLQFLVVAAFFVSLSLAGYASTELQIPFTDKSVDLGVFYYLVMSVVLVYFVNGANLTDGIDGLAGSVALVIMVFFTLVSDALDPASMYVGTAAIGALTAFLIFNFHPAKMFMGDTGSLYLGGLVCGLTVLYRMEILLFLIGFVYLIEGLSVMLQVAYFKKTGKRIFKMAPLHHHFEMNGWSEVKIVFVFTFVTALTCAAAYWGAVVL